MEKGSPITMSTPFRYEFHTVEGVKVFDSDFMIPTMVAMVSSLYPGCVMLSAMPLSVTSEKLFKATRRLYWELANG
jgi:hypothetical protein